MQENVSKRKYKIDACVATDAGRIRAQNEDNFIFAGQMNETGASRLEFWRELEMTQPVVFGIFDGMGGEAYGERASFLMADTCQQYRLHAGYLKEDAKALCCIGNERVCREEEQRKASMGTTASMIIFHENALICNVGDSPIFLYRGRMLYPIYEEHTERRLYEQLHMGEVLNKNQKYRLLQNIGMTEDDLVIQPYIDTVELQDKDIFLICSDGLTDMLGEAEIKNCLNSYGKQCASELVRLALEAGGRDNITVICAGISQLEQQREAEEI